MHINKQLYKYEICSNLQSVEHFSSDDKMQVKPQIYFGLLL